MTFAPLAVLAANSDSPWDQNGYVTPTDGVISPFAPVEWGGGFYIPPVMDFSPIYVVGLALVTLLLAALIVLSVLGRKNSATARKFVTIGLAASLVLTAFGGVAASINFQKDQTNEFGNWAMDRYDTLILSKQQATDLLAGDSAFVEFAGNTISVDLVRGYDHAYYLASGSMELPLKIINMNPEDNPNYPGDMPIDDSNMENGFGDTPVTDSEEPELPQDGQGVSDNGGTE